MNVVHLVDSKREFCSHRYLLGSSNMYLRDS